MKTKKLFRPLSLEGLMMYSSLNTYNPLINYDWSTKNINGLRYLADKGESPKYDAQLYFGQGVYFNGVDQTITVPVSVNRAQGTSVCIVISDSSISNLGYVAVANTSTAHIVQYNGSYGVYDVPTGYYKALFTPTKNTHHICVTQVGSVGKMYVDGVFIGQTTLSNSSNPTAISLMGTQFGFVSGLLKDVFYFNKPLTQEEITQSYEQPELFYEMAQSDNTCVLNMPMCETDGYVRNMKTYSEGVNFVGNTLEYSTAGSGNSIVQNNNIFNITNTVSTGQTYLPYVKFSPNVFTSDLYYQEIEVVCLSGTMQVNSMEDAPKNTYNEVLVAGQTKTYSRVSQFADIGGQKGVITFNGINYPTFTARITLKNIRKITNGIQPIQNYTTACRTSAQNLSYGLQTCKFVRDSLGVIQSASDYLEPDGVGYAIIPNTFISASPTTEAYEFIIKQATTLSTQYYTKWTTLGQASGISTVELTKNSLSNGFLRYRSATGGGLAIKKEDWINSKMYITFVCDSAKAYIYVNGILRYTENTPNNHLLLNNIYLFSESSTYNVEKMTSGGSFILFKVHDKALTQEEITKNYNSYAAKGLLA